VLVNSLRKPWLLTAVMASALLADPGNAQSGNPQQSRATRVKAGITSAEGVIEKLRYVVDGLAGQEKAWEESLFPSIDVFLIGVDTTRPVGADVVFDPAEEEGARKQFHVPIARNAKQPGKNELQIFLTDNLEPIDIQNRKLGRAGDYYKLDSPTLDWEGYLRVVDDYASISATEADVPAGMPSPQAALDALLKSGGYDAAARIQNAAEGTADRKESFGKFREKMLTKVKKRTTETAAEYDLRRTLGEQQLDRLERMFVQSQEVTLGWTTDVKKNEARADLLLTALPGSELARAVAQFGAKPSYFAAVSTTGDALLSGRVNLALDEFMLAQLDKFYDQSQPVWKKKIADRLGKDGITEANVAARQQIADLFAAMLREGKSLGALDGFVEMTPTAAGMHTVLFGIRAADGNKAIDILKLIPEAVQGWQVELNVDSQGGAAIHKITLKANQPEAIKKFYGGTGELFVATSPEAVWISGGENALSRLKETIELVGKSEKTADGVVFSMNLRLGPTLTHLDELAQEKGFNLEEWLGRSKAAAEEPEAEEEGRRRPAQALAGFDWRGVALPELKGAEQDRVHTVIRREANGQITGRTRIERDVLKAAGKVIAKIAEEKLGN
jgi:hypothetical protein